MRFARGPEQDMRQRRKPPRQPRQQLFCELIKNYLERSLRVCTNRRTHRRPQSVKKSPRDENFPRPRATIVFSAQEIKTGRGG